MLLSYFEPYSSLDDDQAVQLAYRTQLFLKNGFDLTMDQMRLLWSLIGMMPAYVGGDIPAVTVSTDMLRTILQRGQSENEKSLRQHIAEAADGLVTQLVTFTTNDDRQVKTSLLEYYAENGEHSSYVFQIQQFMLPFVQQVCEHFGKQEIRCLLNLSSLHAMRLYYTLHIFAPRGKIRIVAPMFKKYLRIESFVEEETVRFGLWERDLLRPAIADINAHTDLTITYDLDINPKHKRHTIDAFVFTMWQKEAPADQSSAISNTPWLPAPRAPELSTQDEARARCADDLQTNFRSMSFLVTKPVPQEDRESVPPLKDTGEESLLRALRERAKLTQGDVCKACDINLQTYIRLEKYHNTGYQTLRRVADYFHVSMDALARNRMEVLYLEDADPALDNALCQNLPKGQRQGMVSGLRFWRMKRRMSFTDLARDSGIPIKKVKSWDQSVPGNAGIRDLVKLADVLGVTVDQLTAFYPASELGLGDHPIIKPMSDNCSLNAIGWYCKLRNLSYTEVAKISGRTSKQAAIHICKSNRPQRKSVVPFAEMEGLTVEEFLEKYRPPEAVPSEEA